ncbi:MAG: hypothetical protein M5U08_09340 [Burkholderiales bacterium]|nr:hypothetical protein [Burkholderiales bacterium]
MLLAGLAVVLAAAAGAMWWLQGRAPQHAAPSGASQPASPAAPAQPRTPEPGTAADAAGPAAASAGRAGSEARATVPPDVDTGDAPSSAMVAPAALDRALHANPVDATASDTGGPPASAPSVVRAERADLRQPDPVAAPVGKAEAPEVAEAAPVTHGQTVAGAIPQAQRHTRVATPVAAATTRVAHAAAAQPPASHGPVKRRSTAASTPAPAAEAAPSGDRVDTPPATPQAEPRIEKQMIESTPARRGDRLPGRGVARAARAPR